VAGVPDLIGDEPVAELGAVSVALKMAMARCAPSRSGSVMVLWRTAVVGLAADLEDPAPHRDRDPVVGELSDDG
jgi:hypothetical protein